ncbi:helix-turn-helix domain-containing protein [Vescimonas sanitatis]|jgi:transcriptional regulator with XRE-family HTH domain|uniref:helix-turn-helix domain-containing protein n=1 Tax=Vescimonas sanitatis TaxID=3376993 RepID=UPI003B8269C4
MSVIDELSPYIRAYPEAFRTARARCGLTNEELSERSGVPYSTVRNAQSGNGGVTIVQAAALARVLSLSIDEMFGAVKPEAEQQRAELEQRIRALELELADRNGEIRSLRDGSSILRYELTRQVYVLIILCSLLSIVAAGYLIWDFHLPTAGLVIGGNMSPGAWFVLLTVLIAVYVMVRCLLRMSSLYTKRSHTVFIGHEPGGDEHD